MLLKSLHIILQPSNFGDSLIIAIKKKAKKYNLSTAAMLFLHSTKIYSQYQLRLSLFQNVSPYII
jgi:hypothetical protein